MFIKKREVSLPPECIHNHKYNFIKGRRCGWIENVQIVSPILLKVGEVWLNAKEAPSKYGQRPQTQNIAQRQ